MFKAIKISILFLLVLVSCNNEKARKPIQMADSLMLASAPDQESKDFTVFFVDSSFTKVKLNAGRARIYKRRKETLLDQNIEADFMSAESGKRVSRLTSDSARVEDETKNMLAMGHVIVVSDSTQTTLKTTVLQWDNIRQELYTTEYVVIETPNETVRGYGFRSDKFLNNYTIFKVSIEDQRNKK